MINFRYHVVSLAAVFLALAVGVALGVAFVDSDDNGAGGGGDSRADTAEQAFETAFADASAGIVGQGLADRRVVVVTTPGARTSEVEDLTARISDAGGSVVGEVALTTKLLDSANRQFAESIAQQSAGDVPGVQSGEDSYTRIGAALARALMGDPELDEQASTIRSAFEQGGLIDLPSAPTERADLALVVIGPSSADSARGEILAAVTSQLATSGAGGAVVGPSTTSVDGGVLDQVRSSDGAGSFSTVDVTDLAAGRLISVLALVKSSGGQNGSWGTTRSADGQLPQ
ncbi:copper transporter [Aeromicrobium alkaliterrae]|uniref:Copper transporter n=1 Tax=Aeromicrobium alkaliterrae TaxID=302168 RepID=A0ABN2JRH0_9ACTN